MLQDALEEARDSLSGKDPHENCFPRLRDCRQSGQPVCDGNGCRKDVQKREGTSGDSGIQEEGCQERQEIMWKRQ